MPVLGLALAILLAATRAPAQGPRAAATMKDLAWLEGTWVSASGQRTVEERWTSGTGGVMFAVSRTLSGDRLVEFEFLRIVERDGGVVYVAQPNRRPPTEFAATQVDDHSVTFENRSTISRRRFATRSGRTVRCDPRSAARQANANSPGSSRPLRRQRSCASNRQELRGQGAPSL